MHRRPGRPFAGTAGSCSRTAAAARPAGDRRRVPGRRASSGHAVRRRQRVHHVRIVTRDRHVRGGGQGRQRPHIHVQRHRRRLVPADREQRHPTLIRRDGDRVQHRHIAERSRFTGRRLQRQLQHHAPPVPGSESKQVVTGLPPRAATGLGHDRGCHVDQLGQAADAHHLTPRTASHSISQLP